MQDRKVGLLVAVLGIHAFGFTTWVATIGFSSDIGTDEQFNRAIGLGALLWLGAAAVIVGLWLAHRSERWLVPIPFLWWIPSLILVVAIVYPSEPGGPIATPGAIAATTVSSSETTPASTPAPTTVPAQQPAPPTGTSSSPPSSLATGRGLCTQEGIHYAGRTADDADVCFTLTADRSAWVEIGFAFMPASGCSLDTPAAVHRQKPEPVPLDASGRIEAAGFSGTIRGETATGVFFDGPTCGAKTFRWRAQEGG